jgi:hypothetical protein
VKKEACETAALFGAKGLSQGLLTMERTILQAPDPYLASFRRCTSSLTA